MEDTSNSSLAQNRAVKVATYASAIALVGTAAIKTKQFVAKRREERRARRHADLTTDA